MDLAYIINNANHLCDPEPYYGTQQVVVGSGELLPITHTRQGTLSTPNRKLSLQSLLHVPSISHNLIFVQKFDTDNFCSTNFNSHGFTIKDMKNNQILP